MIVLDGIQDVIEEMGLACHVDAEDQTVEISAYSPEGQDCYVSFRADYVKNLLADMAAWVDSFDADYEASLWIGDDGHGKNGAPYHIKDIIADMEWWRDQIDKLYDRLAELNREREYTYEMCPHCATEIEYVAEKGVKRCPSCGKHIVICSMCVECAKPCALEKRAHELNGDY